MTHRGFTTTVRFARLCLLTAALAFASVADASTTFPRPTELEDDVNFWVRIFTEVDTQQGLLHDARELGVVYEVIDLSQGVSRRSVNKRVKARKQHYEKVLRSLQQAKRSNLSAEQQRVLELWGGEAADPRQIGEAVKRLRFQQGLADRFRAGLIRSGA